MGKEAFKALNKRYEGLMIILPKDENIRLALGLTSSEFACKCSYPECRSTIAHPDLIKAWGKFRSLVGKAVLVNSGYRCPRHNLEEGGRPLSRHQLGQAIDINLKSIKHLNKSEVEFAAKEAGFTYIKFYETFAHIDVR